VRGLERRRGVNNFQHSDLPKVLRFFPANRGGLPAGDVELLVLVLERLLDGV